VSDFPASPENAVPKDQILAWVAAAQPEPWFPSAAPREGVSRDLLDEPLQELRRAGWLEIVDWVPGKGQAYRLTPAGAARLQKPQQSASLPPERHSRTLQALLAPRPAIVSMAILLVCAVWYLYAGWVAQQQGYKIAAYLRGANSQTLLRFGASYWPLVLAGESWRVLTASWIHTGGVHFLANMLSLAVMGPLAEALWGRWRFSLIWIGSGSLAVAVASYTNPGAIVAGASGGIWGLQTAVIVWVIGQRSDLPGDVYRLWLRWLLIVLGWNILISFVPGVGYQGHFAGGLAGLVLGGASGALDRVPYRADAADSFISPASNGPTGTQAPPGLMRGRFPGQSKGPVDVCHCGPRGAGPA